MKKNPVFRMPVKTMSHQNALKVAELLCPNCNVEIFKIEVSEDKENNFFKCRKCNCVFALPKDFLNGFEASKEAQK